MLPGGIDGAVTPELVPDAVAYNLFVSAVAEPSDASPSQQARERAKLARAQLSEADVAALIPILADFQQRQRAYYRFNDAAFGSPTTWKTAFTARGQYTQSSTTNGPQPELNNAASVFSLMSATPPTPPTSILNCESYWSPTNSQWAALQTWSSLASSSITDSGANQSWSSVGAPGVWSGSPKQAVVKGSILNNALPGKNLAPAIVLFHLAPSGSAPAVIAIQ